MTLMTVICDASWNHQKRTWGWAGFFRGNGWPNGTFVSGPGTTAATGSNECEIMAVVNTLREIEDRGHLLVTENIVLQSDNIRVLHILNVYLEVAKEVKRSHGTHYIGKPMIMLSPVEKEAVRVIRRIVGERTIYLKHVKGHTNRPEGRFAVNRICDRNAKKERRKLEKG